MLQTLPKTVTPIVPVAVALEAPVLVKVDKVEAEQDNSGPSYEDTVITNVLDRIELFAEGIVGILDDLGIDSNHNAFAPLFQQMLDRCETAYHDEIWKTTGVSQR